MSTLPARYLSVSIERSFDEVHDFVAEPTNLPQWASGLGSAVEPTGDGDWSAQTAGGQVRLRFAPKNPFGVVDHTVILPTGEPIANPMRVIANGDGSDVVFTLFRRPEMSEADFERDAEWVLSDLATLKKRLEG